MILKILYLREQHYIGKAVSGHNCSFTYTDSDMVKWVLMCLDEDNRKCTVTLYQTEGECGSGWTTASWGHCDFEYVDSFGGYTHKPLFDLFVEFYPNMDDHSNHVFSVDYDGGDSYYPFGSVSINLKLFEVLPRNFENRPTYIWKGDSGIGKSFLASRFNQEVIVFETDGYDSLPKEITADIIVLGNKQGYTVEDILPRLVNTIPIVCNFSYL